MIAYLRTFVRVGLLSTLPFLGLPAGALAQDWPNKPIRVIINFPPGGPSETLTRVVGERLLPTLGQPLVIENRPGASGNIGAGVPGRLASELLLSMTGVGMLRVPYKGPAPAAMDVVAGQGPCGLLATPTVLPHVESGKLDALAVSTRARSPMAPDVPTAHEAGVAGFDAPSYLILFAQRDTPRND